MATTLEEYNNDVERRATVTKMTLETTEQSIPTPTQEENDKLALHLMHPDEKAPPSAPEMPLLANQQAYLAKEAPTLEPKKPTPRAERRQQQSQQPAPARPAMTGSAEATRSVPRDQS